MNSRSDICFYWCATFSTFLSTISSGLYQFQFNSSKYSSMNTIDDSANVEVGKDTIG